MTLHPLGLIQRGKVSYLGATVNDYNDIRLFALHRFTDAQIKALDDANPRNQISWQDYIASGAGGFNASVDNQIELKAWVDSPLADLLKETPLSENQQLHATDDGYQLTATVSDTWQLHWWILSQGARMVVQAPVALHNALKDEISRMYRQYQNK